MAKENRIKKVLTIMQQAFKKQQQRLMRAIRREYNKTGLELDRTLIPEMPNRVTKKRLQEITEIRPKDLRRESKFADEDGVIITYKEAKKRIEKLNNITDIIEQSNVNQMSFRPVETLYTDRQIVFTYLEGIKDFNSGFRTTINNWIKRLIKEHGYTKVAQMLIEGASNGVVINYEVAYDYEKTMQYMSDMLNYFDADAETRTDIMEAVEQEAGYESPQ